MLSLNAGLALLLELAAIAAFARWGWRLADGPVLAGLAAMLCAGLGILLWAVLAAPLSSHRLPMPWLILFKAAVYGCAVLALARTGQGTLALGLGAVEAGQLALALALGVP